LREGGSPFPEDHLPDGGSGGAERVVPDDFGTDWTAEITSCSNRMRKSGRNHMKTTATTEAVSSPPEENEHWSQQWRRNTAGARQKPRADWKNVLQIRGAGRKSRKPPTPFVGMKPYGKCQNNAIVYYLPGTTGWSVFNNNSGLAPTVLWNALAQHDASFGVQSNQFGFNITGSSNLVIVVEASTNLANPVWSPVATNTLTGGSSYFSDPQWTNYPCRFYRFRSP
jgi:hypothetical protein